MTADPVVQAFAPAKVNLSLHITGQREDGYHLLDSLVMLVDVGDTLTLRRSTATSLIVSGPMSRGVPTDETNLVVRAAAASGTNVDIELEKHLPAAAGIGGGSSDAAACLRGLSRLENRPLPDVATQLELGADVPVCMQNQLARMRGVGDVLEILGTPPNWPMILVNPGIQVSTAAVFKGLQRKENSPMPDDFPLFADWGDQVSWLTDQRNDLEAPAISVAPAIGDVLHALRHIDGCMMARMSGSGATCFAIMYDDDARDDAVQYLRQVRPEWWVMPTERCGVAFR